MSEDFELELTIAENEFPEALEHPSIARIKEGEGIPVKKWKPFGKNKNGEKSGTSHNADSLSSSDKRSVVKIPPNRENAQSWKTKSIENMSLSEIISTRGIGEKSVEQRPANEYENMSLDEIIWHKSDKSEIRYGDTNSEPKRQIQIKGESHSEPCKRRAQNMREPPSSSKVQNLGNNNSLNKVGGSKTVTFTPQSGIRMLCELGYMVAVELNELKNEDHPLFHARRWRACYYDGRDKESKIVGVGEAPRKTLAKESAALDFIEKMQAQLPNENLPKCAVPKGCRISPSVLVAVENLCDKADIPRPSFAEDLVRIKGREKYQFTVIVGEEEFKDTSYDYKYAKYGAAKKAYDALNEEGREFTLDDIIKGDDCLSESEYCFVECEELHIVQAKKPPPQRVLEAETYSVSATTSPIPWNGSEGVGESCGRNSPQSSVSTANPPKRMKIASVAEYSMPPTLEKIRRRMQSRQQPVHSEDGEAPKSTYRIVPSHYGQMEEGVESAPQTVDSLSISGITSFKRTIDGLKKPARNLTITVSTENYDENNLDIRDSANKTTESSVTGTEEYPKNSKAHREGIFKMWEPELRNAVLTDMEPWKDVRFDNEWKESKETKEITNLNPFLSNPNHSRFADDKKPYVHEVTITGFGFGEFFKLSDVGAKIGVLRNFACVNNFFPAAIDVSSGGERETGEADMVE